MDKNQPREDTILYVGRLTEEKGMPMLLNLAKEYPRLNFRVIGSGKCSGMLSLPNIEQLGLMDKKELCEQYNKVKVCLFPSLKENFPLAAIEAMSCGCAVAATRQGFCEIISHKRTGHIVKEYTV